MYIIDQVQPKKVAKTPDQRPQKPKYISDYLKVQMGNTDALIKVSFAVKRYHYHSNSYKGKHLVGGSLLTVSEVQSVIIIVGSMTVCRQTWC